MGAVSSTLHMKVKFRIEQGVATMRGNQQVARQCLVVAACWKTSRLNIRRSPRRRRYINYRNLDENWGLVVPRN